MKKWIYAKIILVVIAIVLSCTGVYLVVDYFAARDSLVESYEDMMSNKTANESKSKFYIQYQQEQAEKVELALKEEQENTQSTGIEGNIDPLNIDQSKRAVYKFLSSMGYDIEAIAGIMGNMNAESGILFGTTQGHTHDGATNVECRARGNCFTNTYEANAHGLVQWDGGRREGLLKGAESNGIEWTDAAYQLSYLKNELEGSYKNKVGVEGIYAGMLSGVDKVEWTTYKWATYYEVCSGAWTKKDGFTPFDNRSKIGHWQKRLDAARALYVQIQNGELE